VVVANATIGLWAVIAHANLRLPLGRLGVLLVSPAFHRHHHGRGVGAYNLGGMFAAWDHLFGTWQEPAVESSVPCGALEAEDDGLLGLLAHPFRRPRPSPGIACARPEA
jgi:sterol desaturase/sphingolipid hydroxylase (fatty acid hydroxylase superfamily)